MRRALSLCLFLLLFPALVFAQSSTGSISGAAVDDSGAALPGVTITATNAATGATRTTVSNETGRYQIALLPSGTYGVSGELDGFRPVRHERVVVHVGTDVTLNLRLAVGVSETMTVTAAAPLIEAERSQVSSVVNETAIENLPTNGRNFIDFVLTTPGVVKDVRAGDISFAGQRGTLNSLVIDGANNDNTFFGQALGRTGSGRAPYQFSQDAVKEFQVNSNAYSAEYGRAGGAVINVVTKSGTNTFEGTAFYFLRDRDLNANDYINEINNRAKSPYHYDQYGMSFGGPIIPDRHFFFVNYDAQRNSIDNVIQLGIRENQVPNDAASLAGWQKILALGGDYPKNQDQDVYLVKTDHELFSNNHLSFRWNRQRFTGVNFENGVPTNALEHTGNSLVSTDTFSLVNATVFSSSIFNEVRGQYAKDREPGFANSALPEAQVFQGGARVLNIGRNTFSPRETTIERYQLADTVTLLAGRHTLKGGFDVSRDDILNYFPGNFFGSYIFDSLADFENGRASRYTQAFAGPGTSGPITNPNMTEYAVFAQDEWHLTPSLTVNAGLRYDFQDIAQPTVRNPDAQLAARGIDTSVVPEDTNNVSPRVGFAWTMNDRTILRGGYGIFYGRTPAIMVGTAHSNNGINVQTITFNRANNDPLPAYPNIFNGIPTGVALPRPTIFAFDAGFENPEVHQGSLGFERALATDVSFGVTYQWVQGNNLPRATDINVGAATEVTVPITQIDPTDPARRREIKIGEAVVKRYASARPFSNFSRIIQFQSTADSEYNGVTLDLQKRFANNWQARLAYTYATVDDNRPDATAVVPGTDDFKFAQDPLALNDDWGPGDNDVRHRVVLSGVWSLDSYAQRIDNGFMRTLASGWTFSGIASYQSGQPYSVLVNGDLNNDGNARNDRAPGLARNTENYPAQLSIDPRITRDIPLVGGVRLQLIAEAFNVLNESNVSGVRNTLYAFGTDANRQNRLLLQTNYGEEITSAGPRIVQVAAKLTF